MQAGAQWRQLYDELSFYVVAHQDDWQLFMGTNVFNDINAFDEKNPYQNGKKVVLIYTTAGNLNDDDDSKSCDCKDPYNQYKNHIPYWSVREKGAKNSLHLAACRKGGWGSNTPYPDDQTVTINGHTITKYVFKNTTSYYLRLKAGAYGLWKFDPHTNVGTVDSSTTYTGWSDFVNTLYYIYKAEMDSSITTGKANFNFPDINEDINPNDHPDHIVAGRAGCEAAKILSADMSKCFNESLFIDYNSQNLPPNLSAEDAQNEAALTGVYSLALLDFNAWPEWGSLYREWNNRNYFRTITTCQNPVPANILAQDGLVNLTVKAFPIPANQNLSLQFNLPTKSVITIKVADVSGAAVFENSTRLNADNTLSINTGSFPNGSYLLMVGADGSKLASIIFEVMH